MVSYKIYSNFAVLIFIFIFAACSGKKETATIKVKTAEDAVAAFQSPQCPQKMIYLKYASLCVDMFEYTSATSEIPMRSISWKDAGEICNKQGKKLPAIEEWESICRGEEARVYPYGQTYQPGFCRIDLYMEDGPAPPGISPFCNTPEGVFDLSGNVWEWTATPGFEPGTYYIKGGAWWTWPSVSTCDLRAWEFPSEGGPDIGFRCISSSRGK